MTMTQSRYVERAMFLLGEQNTGKSTQLRSMFLDQRLGSAGQVPGAHNLANSYALSNERWLYLRLTSPHEAGETMDEFLDKCHSQMVSGPSPARRWNFAGALQVNAANQLSNAPDVIQQFSHRFVPERIRALVLCPDCTGNTMDWNEVQKLTSALRAVPNCEVLTVDATDRYANGLLYTDFFDFT